MLGVKDKGILLQIIKRCSRVTSKVSNITEAEFSRNDDVKEVVCFNLFQIGELAKELKDDFRQEYPEVRVRGLVGMRNMFAHQYHNMDIDEIWSTATIDIPLIASVIKKILVDNNIDTEKDSVEET